MMDHYAHIVDRMRRIKCQDIRIFIYLAYSTIIILIIPSLVKERLIIGSVFFDFLIRVFIVLSLYQSIHFAFNFEQSISKFYGGVVSFRVSELDKTRKSFLVIFCLLSGLLTYLILNFLLSFLIPVLGPLTKIFASIFGLCIAIPVWVKVKPEKGERILFL